MTHRAAFFISTKIVVLVRFEFVHTGSYTVPKISPPRPAPQSDAYSKYIFVALTLYGELRRTPADQRLQKPQYLEVLLKHFQNLDKNPTTPNEIGTLPAKFHQELRKDGNLALMRSMVMVGRGWALRRTGEVFASIRGDDLRGRLRVEKMPVLEGSGGERGAGGGAGPRGPFEDDGEDLQKEGALLPGRKQRRGFGGGSSSDGENKLSSDGENSCSPLAKRMLLERDATSGKRLPVVSPGVSPAAGANNADNNDDDVLMGDAPGASSQSGAMPEATAASQSGNHLNSQRQASPVASATPSSQPQGQGFGGNEINVDSPSADGLNNGVNLPGMVLGNGCSSAS